MSTLLAKIFPTRARLIVWVLFIMLWTLKIGKPVQAQSLTLSILQANATITLNGTNSVTLQVQVENVVDLSGYDISFTYDSAVLKLATWEHGGFLSSLWEGPITNEPGFLHLAFAQAGVPAVSGSGTLLRLTFSGKAIGESPVTITKAQFGKPSGATFYPQLFHGQVTTMYDPTKISNGILAGTVILQGQKVTSGVPVTLDDGQFLGRGPFSGTSINQSGSNLTINPVVMDLYTVTTAKPGYLNIDSTCGKTKAIFGTTSTLNPLKLKGGNAVGTDNEINIQDITAITGVYGQANTIGVLRDADINANGTVDVFDLAMAAGNYGLNCVTAYADWTP